MKIKLFKNVNKFIRYWMRERWVTYNNEFKY